MGGYPSSTFSSSPSLPFSLSPPPARKSEKSLPEEDQEMPPVFIEKKRRRGTAGKRRSLDQVPESAYWPGLKEATEPSAEHPKNPPSTESSSSVMEEAKSTCTNPPTTDAMEGAALPQAPSLPSKESTALKPPPDLEAPSWKIVPFQKPRIRSRKRKKKEDTTWKEILQPHSDNPRGSHLQEMEGDFGEGLPEDLQIPPPSEKRPKLESSKSIEPTTPTTATTDSTSPSPDLPSLPTAAAGGMPETEPQPASSAIPSSTSQVDDILRQLPPMAGMIQQMYRILCNSVGGSSLLLSPPSEPESIIQATREATTEAQRLSQLCQRQEEVVSRLEAMERVQAEETSRPDLEQVLRRLESFLERQEKVHSEMMTKMAEKVQRLEEENQRQRVHLQTANSVEASLQQTKDSLSETLARLEKVQTKLWKQETLLQEERASRETERKENRSRLAEALQQIEQLRNENEMLRHQVDLRHASGETRLQSTSSVTTTRKHSRSPDWKRSINRKTKTSSGESPRRKSSAIDKRKTPRQAFEEDLDDEGFSSEKSDDSPFSLPGIDSRGPSIFSRRRRISPGGALVGTIAPEATSSQSMPATNLRQEPTAGKSALFPSALMGRRNRFARSSIRDLVPDYGVDSLRSIRGGM